MPQALTRLTHATHGQGFYDLTRPVAQWVAEQAPAVGLLTVFCRHTSASLVIQENADPTVRQDLTTFLDTLAPEDDRYVHADEGPDDMPAHIRTMVTATSLTIPVERGRLLLGTWQGLYLAEHRRRPHRREIVLHLLADCA
ncbi:secondary thiamine-phosphate synthase enzyme YjbQ [Lichenihabitans sp. Uapishka_5]|uniref:secondary thiamine-phosphate synthase enzyme YjbQ n=1 Tax=Lichenihabitans sp. Uapishka_5 TaxID=3037302 RepID=UPI0029E7D836|nr:secondary thiamine-phosphate synthase enzyme YjbQ [Lichenihabitans sp. Uapishka_5]MDX7951659.1 secondary thiamine-phosphate synthase enzyme YjbQ [Lichenihabitans sp. Uapishka_5]